jgi:signal transduction histidine kinase
MNKVPNQKQQIFRLVAEPGHSRGKKSKMVHESDSAKPPSISPPRLYNTMMSEITNESIKVLCQTGGEIMAASRDITTLFGPSKSSTTEIKTVAELAQLVDCGELQPRFEAFNASGDISSSFSLNCGGSKYQVTLRRLDDLRYQHLILMEVGRQEGKDEKFLVEAGRMTSRLIHDFKNQMGGLKLYAAYLKKRFADQPEGLEIAEKIIQGLNTMAEQAALVSKLTRPLELNHERNDPVAFISQVINDQKSRAEARNLKIDSEVENGVPPASIDIQQLRTALNSIIARAMDATPEGSTIRVKLQSLPGEMIIEIEDQGEILGEQQRQALFDLLAGDRINNTSLDLAYARRIVEEHGGQVRAFAGSTAGTIVQVKLPV